VWGNKAEPPDSNPRPAALLFVASTRAAGSGDRSSRLGQRRLIAPLLPVRVEDGRIDWLGGHQRGRDQFF